MSVAHVDTLGRIFKPILLITLEHRHDVRDVVAVHRIEVGRTDDGDRRIGGIERVCVFKLGELGRGNGRIAAVHPSLAARLRRPTDKGGAGRQSAAVRRGSRRQANTIAVPIRRPVVRSTALPIERFALDVIEQHLRLVRSDEQVVALKTVGPVRIIGGIGRRFLVRLVLLDLLASSHSIGIGLAVKPAVVLSNSVHTHVGLAEPAHKAVAAVGLGQTLWLCGGILLKRYRCIALGQALGRSRQHGAHGKGVRIRGRLVFAKFGLLDCRGARTGKIDRRLNALAMHGNFQLVIHRPLIGVRGTQGLVVSGRAHGAGTEVVVVLFPQLARGVAFVIPRTIAIALDDAVAAKRGDFLFGRVALAAAV